MDIAACVQWMTPFAMTLRDVGQAELKFFSQIPTEDTHAIQTHSVDLNLLVSKGLLLISEEFYCFYPEFILHVLPALK